MAKNVCKISCEFNLLKHGHHSALFSINVKLYPMSSQIVNLNVAPKSKQIKQFIPVFRNSWQKPSAFSFLDLSTFPFSQHCHNVPQNAVSSYMPLNVSTPFKVSANLRKLYVKLESKLKSKLKSN